MKQTRRLISGLVLSAVALSMISTVAAQTAVEGVATVIRMKGPARYTTGNNTWQALKKGMVLKPGSIVQTSTEKGSFVDLVLSEVGAAVPTPAIYQPNIPSSYTSSQAYQPSAEQNVVRLWENSALGIDKLSTMQTGADNVSDTQLDLKVGRVSGNVKKMSSASKYEIKLPNGVAGIRGTLYDVTAEGVVRVFVGSVVLAWVDAKGNVVTQVVSGGQQYDARTGELTPLSQASMQNFDRLMVAMRYVQPTPMATYVADKTVVHVSPVGPPFHPPGPPPVIPPGRGLDSTPAVRPLSQ